MFSPFIERLSAVRGGRKSLLSYGVVFDMYVGDSSPTSEVQWSESQSIALICYAFLSPKRTEVPGGCRQCLMVCMSG